MTSSETATRPAGPRRRSLPPQVRARGVTAVLGPTNTGKTHLAIERMLGHDSGLIGLPLRLLAREVYGRLVARVGPEKVALVTGEEKIKPERPRYWVATAEAMPRDLDVSFVAIDEVQLAGDLDRGHIFTDRLLNQRGRAETMLIGSGTARPLVEALVPGVHVVTRPRLSQLTFAGEKKLSRLPPRTAIVAFSAEEVYAVAELIRRQRGGAAVVLGALSPRTRNAQVELYQAGDVDYLVATDAVGMGLNLDVDHVAFAADRKFDGHRFRRLLPAEMGQIAGRAGRHLQDGTFGTTGRCQPFDPETVEALEGHRFDPLRILQWRNPDLDFRSLPALQASLAEHPREPGLTRAPMAEDVAALEILAREEDIRAHARTPAEVERLWEVCGVPDYRKVSPVNHADLVGQLYRFLMKEGRIPADWFARQVAALDRIEGDIDALSNRISQIRTWTFVANRAAWLAQPEHWQAVTRQVEDRLSDALHERLASRFVDRRTSVLMRRLRENAMLDAEITPTGDVTVEGQHVGHLHGFQFAPDPQAGGEEAKTLRNAASRALAGEIEARADRFAAAPDATLVLSHDGTLRWTGDPVAKLEPGDKLYEPRLRILADEHLTGPARDKVEARLKAWLKATIVRLLGPAQSLEESPQLAGIARGIGFQIAEALGVLERAKVLQEVRGLDQEGRASLRKLGVRFGAYHLYLPALLKPAPRILAAQLWALRHGGLDQKGLDEIAHLAASGRTTIPADPAIARGLYRAAGFRASGTRAVRVDILERLADLIRPAQAYRPGVTPGDPPPGTADGDGFVATVGMTSLVGCSGEDFASILKSLGYAAETRPGPAITVPLLPAAPRVPAVAAAGIGGAPAAGVEVAPAEGALDAPVEAAPGEEGQASGAADASQEAAPEPWGAPAAEAAPVAEEAAVDAELAVDVAGTVDAPDEPPRAEAAGLSTKERVEDAAPPAEAPADAQESPAEPSLAEGGAAAPDRSEGSEAAEPREAEIGIAGPEAPDAEQAVVAEAAAPEAAEPSAAQAGETEAEQAGAVESGEAGGEQADAAAPDLAAVPPQDDALTAAAAPEAAEVALIEVWRLHRQQHGRPRHGRPGGPRPEGRDGAPRREGFRGRPGQRPPGERAPGDRSPRPAPAAAAPVGEGVAGEAPRRDQRPPRDARPPRGPEGRPPQAPPPRGPEGRHPQAPRPDQRNAPRPERRERAPDPDSPFAKLAALKAQLEGRGRTDG